MVTKEVEKMDALGWLGEEEIIYPMAARLLPYLLLLPELPTPVVQSDVLKRATKALDLVPACAPSARPPLC
jgi:hypothetical protein